MPKDVDPPEILFFKEKVAEKINERFMVGNEHKCDDIIASALYPCYRKLKFLSNSSKELVKTKLEELCLQLAPEMNYKGQEEIPELPTVPPKVKRESEEHNEAAMKYLLGDVYEVSDDEDDGIQTEVERYMAEPQKRENPLGWWRANAHHFPHMQKLAKRFLCRPSTSVPSERLFSAAGHTVTKDRARLDPDTVDELLFFTPITKKRDQHTSKR